MKKARERVSFRGVSIGIWPYRDGWRFSWPDPTAKGGWRYAFRKTKKDARAAAHARAVELAHGQPDLSELDAHQARLASAFLALGPTWDDLEKLKRLKSVSQITIGAAVNRFCTEKEKVRGHRTHHLTILRTYLSRLVNHLGPDRPLLLVTAVDISAWLDAQDVGPKTRNDYRAAAVALWRWATKVDLLPPARFSEPEKIPVLPIPKWEVPIFSPAEMRLLLDAVRPEFLPWLVLASFSGLRTGEIHGHTKPPLVWERIHRDRDIIEIPAAHTKTGRRKLVPIIPALHAWLDHLGRRSGQVTPAPACTGETARLGEILDREFSTCRGWPNNAPRHSYGSYRVAETKDVPAVSLEMDNSPTIIRRHYLEACSQDEAAEYFALRP